MTPPPFVRECSVSGESTHYHSGHPSPRGWVLYDGDCAFCLGMVRRFRAVVERRGFCLAPLQTPWVRERLALPDDELLAQMLLLTSDGRLGGADALVEIARHIWWGWPLFALSKLPGARPLLAAGYCWMARRRHSLSPEPARAQHCQPTLGQGE